jgi:hypothetical protein
MAVRLAVNPPPRVERYGIDSPDLISKSWCQQWESNPHELALNGF